MAIPEILFGAEGPCAYTAVTGPRPRPVRALSVAACAICGASQKPLRKTPDGGHVCIDCLKARTRAGKENENA